MGRMASPATLIGGGGKVQGPMDMSGDTEFSDVEGSPTFSSHDHSESGTASIPMSGIDGNIPNSKLVNSTIDVNAGSHITATQSVGIGGELDISIDDDFLLNDGDAMSGSLNMSKQDINDLDTIHFNTESNDFFKLQDGSGGDNNAPYTMRFDAPRDFRIYAGGDDGVGNVAQFNLDGTVRIQSGPLYAQNGLVLPVGTDEWV